MGIIDKQHGRTAKQSPSLPDSGEGGEQEEDACRSMSIRTKILLLLTTALFVFGVVAAATSYRIYMDASIAQHKQLGEGSSELVASVIDPARVDSYLTEGYLAEGYTETMRRLQRIQESSPLIQYVYVYRILEDGCHVVFDLDAERGEGSNPGDIVAFDDAFREYIPTLLAGGNIEPIISDETYGWLLTVYTPVYDEKGVCQCYAAVDISMDGLRAQAAEFLSRLILIFLLVFVVILLAAFWLAKYNLILPINTMAHSASAFAYHSNEALERSLEAISKLNIRTGDEVENLYRSFVKMTRDSVRYVTDIRKKNETISKMQKILILTLADMVERRDENTGQHIKKTAAYVKIILEEMKKEGIYKEQLTDEFMENVINSAPLHDVGKINVPDAILNKPGKLTDEEFDTMKSHTVVGGKIIASLIETVPDSEYLHEAQNLATYHHEKWNGRGYPSGLSGEDIPLSARIMAVADVFDALVSNRSYKKGFPVDKALGIIREDSGTHFDPKVVEAFFSAKEKVLKVAEEFNALEDGEKPGCGA